MYKPQPFVFLTCFAASSAACAYSPLNAGYDLGSASTTEPDAASSFPTVEESPGPDASPDTAIAVADASVPSDDTGVVDPRSDSAPPACALSLPSGSASCDACIAKSCCAEDNACGQDQNCFAVIACVDQCLMPDGGLDASPPDPNACMTQCSQQSPSGAAELNALDNCVAALCPGSC